MARKKITKPEEPVYVVNLTLPYGTYVTNGGSILEALQKLKFEKNIKPGDLQIFFGSKTVQVKLWPKFLRKLPEDKIYTEILAKRLALLLK